MGRVRVLTAAGAETTSFGALGTSSGITSGLSTAISSDLASGLSDVSFDSSGRLLVGGTFGLKRIKTDGTLDAGFVTDIASTVRSIRVHGAPGG